MKARTLIWTLAVITLAVAVTNTGWWDDLEMQWHLWACDRCPTYERVMVWWGWHN